MDFHSGQAIAAMPMLKHISTSSFHQFQVIAGAHDIFDRSPPVQVRTVSGILSFQPADAAVIKLNYELAISNTVKPISLAEKDFYPAGYLCHAIYQAP